MATKRSAAPVFAPVTREHYLRFWIADTQQKVGRPLTTLAPPPSNDPAVVAAWQEAQRRMVAIGRTFQDLKTGLQQQLNETQRAACGDVDGRPRGAGVRVECRSVRIGADRVFQQRGSRRASGGPPQPGVQKPLEFKPGSQSSYHNITTTSLRGSSSKSRKSRTRPTSRVTCFVRWAGTPTAYRALGVAPYPPGRSHQPAQCPVCETARLQREREVEEGAALPRVVRASSAFHRAYVRVSST